MAQQKRKLEGLEMDEDTEFQRRAWNVQRAGWHIFALLILLAVLGLFGDGVLSKAAAGQPGDALWLAYPRFARFEDQIHFTVYSNTAQTDGQIILQISQDYMENVEVENVSPQPESEAKDSGWLTYTFQADSPSLQADFYFRPHKIGWHSGTLRSQNGDTVTFSQFIYP